MEKVYLLLGPEKGLKNDFLKRLKTSLGECEVSRFYAFDDFEDGFYGQLGGSDLFAEKKLVILDEVQELKTKEKIDPLVSYIKNPTDSVVLVLMSAIQKVAPEIMAAIPDQKNGIVRFFELFENKKEEWVSSFFSRNGVRASSDAVSAIITKVENNISEFEVVCSQLVMYVKNVEGRDTLTADDVEEFLVHTKGEDDFSLFSSIISGNLEKSIECLRALLSSSENQAMVASTIPSKLSTYFRRTLFISNLSATMPIEKAFSEKLFAEDKPISAKKLKDAYTKAVNTYSKKELERILVLLSEYDIKVKEAGRLQSIMVEKCITDIVKNRGRHPQPVTFLKMKS